MKISEQALDIVRRAGAMVKQHHGKLSSRQIARKGVHDYVTEIDKRVEEFLVEQLGALIPGSGFLTEEKTAEDLRADYIWIIDPIDGTTNFIHGLYPVAVSVALQHKGQTIWGMVYEPGLDELFYADETGAYLNGRPISVSEETALDRSLIATGFPYKNYDKLDAYLNSFRYLMFHTAGIRRLGSAAADLVYVACGRMDGFYEYGLSPWDVAAGAYIVQQAGGRVTDFTGGDDWMYGGEILATNGHIHREFLETLRKTMQL
ncbi:MAG: inositol monophosphatase [Chlorobi bacterium]|nr:inositol monophosphatase [Chlorobiota bacterium]